MCVNELLSLRVRFAKISRFIFILGFLSLEPFAGLGFGGTRGQLIFVPGGFSLLRPLFHTVRPTYYDDNLPSWTRTLNVLADLC